MAQGTDYSGNKSSLLSEGIEELVFKNGKGLIDGNSNQKALKNLVETFWAPEDGKQYARKDGTWVEVSGGGLEIETFQTIGPGIDFRAQTEYLTNSSCIKVTGSIVTTNIGIEDDETVLISNVIPQDFKNFQWARLVGVFTVLNEDSDYYITSIANGGITDALGISPGTLTIDQISSNDSVSVTNIDISGYDKGSGNSYVSDLPAINKGLIQDYDDMDETEIRYNVTSPLDLNSQGLSLSWSSEPGSNVRSMNISFSLKFDLINRSA